MSELSLHVYLPVVGHLFDYLRKQQGFPAVCQLDAAIFCAFLLERVQDRSSESVRLLSISLRSFLRFLHVRGKIRKDLTVAIPTVRKWSQAGIPKKLTPAEVDRVLAVPDQQTATGRRDYAILLLLAKLGLRSSEVIALELGDVRWRTGEIRIRGKGHRLEALNAIDPRHQIPVPRHVTSVY